MQWNGPELWHNLQLSILSEPVKAIKVYLQWSSPSCAFLELRALLWNNKRIWWKTLKDFQKYNHLTKQISTLPVIHHINQIWLSWIDLYTMSTAAILVKFCTNVLRSLWSCHQKALSYLTVIHRSGIMQGLILPFTCWLANANPINASHTFSFCLKKAPLLLSSNHSKSVLL